MGPYVSMELYTTKRTFNDLHELADGRGKQRKISRQALVNLLMDHSRMITRLRELGDEVAE